MQKEEGVSLSPDDAFSSRPHLVWRWGWSVPRRAPGSLSCFPVLPAPVLAQSERRGGGAGLHVGICCGWEGVCGTAKTSFSDLEGWVTGGVCMLLAGPLPSGVTHSCEHVAACRAAACHAWLSCGQVGSLRGGVMSSPSCSLGSEGEEVESSGCFWEKSSLMWGAGFLQVGFVPSFLSLLFFARFYLRNTLVWQSHLLSSGLCPGSVTSSWLGWKTTHFPSPFSFQQ